MKKILVFLIFSVLLAGCTKYVYLPVEKTRYVAVRDSVYFRDTLVRIELEKARLSDFCNVDDTLVLSDAYSRSAAWIDTTSGTLKGTMETIREYVEKNVPVKEKIVYKDSVVYETIPAPYEVEKPVRYVPWYAKVLSWIGGLALAAVAVLILVKLGVFKRYL